MKDLLARLRKCDQATYEKIARGLPMQPNGQYLAFDNGQITACQYHEAYMPFGGLLPEVACAWLQACLQEAIAANHWWLKQSTFTARPSAKIQKPTDAIWKDYSAQADTPAQALLAAYILAKEAT